MATTFRTVDMHVARNPVARAVAKRVLVDALRDFQLRVYLLPEGSNASSDVDSSIKAITVTIMAMEHAGHGEHPSISVMRGAQSALMQCAARRFKWHTRDAVAVDQGLQLVADLYPQLAATDVAWAWQQMRRIEQAAREGVPA